ncbi:hypothetical protein TNCV_3859531 [Trichonephila clavipes]|nr:hypothetical protein TNCV_3859531 [Trichonephila clavipes]
MDLLELNDVFMADKGFLIEEELDKIGFQFSKLTSNIQSNPFNRSSASATPLVPATDFHAHHHQPRSKTKPFQKQDRGRRD